ncbi:MAG: transcription initiation factor IIB [Candidatus Nealsonbacteria bacterium]
MKEKIISQLKIETCPECRSTNLVYEHWKGQLTCLTCGFVIQENIMDSKGGVRKPKNRTGKPGNPLLHDKGLQTRIGFPEERLPVSTQETMKRLRKLQSRYWKFSSEEERLGNIMGILELILNRLEIESEVKIKIQGSASQILRQALKKLRWMKREPLVVGAIYTACKLLQIPKSLGEISELTSIRKEIISRHHKLLCRALKIKITPLGLLRYIPKISGELGISPKAEALASHILIKAEEKGITQGKNPRGLIAAALYIACQKLGEWITQKKLADASNVTEPTVRARYKEFKKILEALKSE